VLSGGDLPHPLRLAAIDEADFMQRLSPPPKFDDPPGATGPTYTLTTPYWDEVLRGDRADRAPAEAAALYYPQGGFVRARQDGKDAWLILDLRQQAILERYLRLGREGRLPEAPGIMHVLFEASKTEMIGINIGHDTLPEATRAAFWRTIEPYVGRVPQNPEPPARLRTDEHGAWITFNLPEGRAIQVFYAPNYDNIIVDSTGTEMLQVSPGTRFVVSEDSSPFSGPPPRGGAIQIEQEDGPGSPVWWAVMVGAGVFCLAAAVWLQRRLQAPRV
jgi:hypothetical protein